MGDLIQLQSYKVAQVQPGQSSLSILPSTSSSSSITTGFTSPLIGRINTAAMKRDMLVFIIFAIKFAVHDTSSHKHVHTTPAAILTSNSTLFIYSTLYITAHNHLVTIHHCLVRGDVSAIHPSLWLVLLLASSADFSRRLSCTYREPSLPSSGHSVQTSSRSSLHSNEIAFAFSSSTSTSIIPRDHLREVLSSQREVISPPPGLVNSGPNLMF